MIAAHVDHSGKRQSVEEHCKNVAGYAGREAESIHLSNTLYLAGLLHDMGKDTELFDKYICDAVKGMKVHRGEVNHSSAGGKYIIDLVDKKDKWQQLLAEIIAYSVFSHHGILDMLSVQGEDIYFKRQNPHKDIRYSEAIENSRAWINEEEIKEYIKKASDEIRQLFLRAEELADNIVGIQTENSDIENKEIKIKSKRFFVNYVERLVLSVLIDADRRDTAEFMNGQKERRLTQSECNQKWKEYLSKLERVLNAYSVDSQIAKWRGELSEQCAKHAERGDGIYRLSIPTGGGKTLSGMRFALKLAIKTEKKHIYYVAPFLSILEQNANIYRGIFEDESNVLEHHSNVVYETETGEDLNELELLEDTWSAPVILTTMVQFMNTLFSGKASSVRRLHQLKDSVLIIDETQAIPVKCTYMFTMAMNFLNAFCNTTVVLCTATQPLFDKVKYPVLFGKEREIIYNSEYYWECFKRVEVIDNTKQKMDSETLAQFCVNQLEDNLLVILNTKRAVQKLYDVITGICPADVSVIQLTTYMCAAHRIDVIEHIKKILKSERLICVSTQLIEAGVDISFSKVIRSITGVDSIAQAAGRCNRNAEQKIGNTFLVDLLDEATDRLTDISKSKEATRQVLDYYSGDLLSKQATDLYYKQYFWNRQSEMYYSCKTHHGELVDIFSLLSIDNESINAYRDINNKRYPHCLCHSFEMAGELFHMIDEGNTIGLIVPYKEAETYLELLENTYEIGEKKRLLRKLQRYTVNLFTSDRKLKELDEMHAIYKNELAGVFILGKPYYGENGVTTDAEIESLIF